MYHICIRFPDTVSVDNGSDDYGGFGNVLAVGCWDQTLSFYELSGMYVCMYCMFVCIYVCMYVCMCVCVCCIV